MSVVGHRFLPPRQAAGLAAVGDRLGRAGVPWLLAGGAACVLAGGAIARPRDLDLEVGEPDVPAAAAALGLVSGRVTDADGTTSLRALGRVAGADVDLTGGLEARGPGGRLAPDFALQRAWAARAEAAGRAVWLAPVEEAMARALVRGDGAALARVAAGARGGPAPRAAYLLLRLSAAASAAR